MNKTAAGTIVSVLLWSSSALVAAAPAPGPGAPAGPYNVMCAWVARDPSAPLPNRRSVFVLQKSRQRSAVPLYEVEIGVRDAKGNLVQAVSLGGGMRCEFLSDDARVFECSSGTGMPFESASSAKVTRETAAGPKSERLEVRVRKGANPFATPPEPAQAWEDVFELGHCDAQ